MLKLVSNRRDAVLPDDGDGDHRERMANYARDMQEAEHLDGLRHPHIVTLYKSFQIFNSVDSAHRLFVMDLEYCSRGFSPHHPGEVED